MTPDDAIFLAIKPRYADDILKGTKTVELRRTRPKDLRSGSLVVLYASSPVKAVLGIAEVEKVITATPDELWPLVADQGSISQREFKDYFANATEATGIFVRAATRSSSPYRLEEIRVDWPEFHPPQAFRYLRSMGDWAVALLRKCDAVRWIGLEPETSPIGAD